MDMLLQMGAVAVAAAVAGAGMTAIVRQWAARRLLDVPNQRSSHSRPTPRGGGVSIVVVTTAVALISGAAAEALHVAVPLAGGGLLVAGVSLIDDLRTVPSAVRFFAHCAAALVAVGATGAWTHAALPFDGTVQLGPVGALLTVVWVAGLINAYNFMDGIDGIAGTQALIAGTGWCCVALLLGMPAVAIVAAALAGAALGFLFLNWPPASIFLGDVGSAFLGYCFAVLPLALGAANPRLPLAAVLMVGPFVLDAGYTVGRRLSRGENVFQAHRSHLYQRLIMAGRSHARVTVIYGLLAAIFSAAGIMWGARLARADLAAGIALACFAALAFHVRAVARTAHSEPPALSVGQDEGKGR